MKITAAYLFLIVSFGVAIDFTQAQSKTQQELDIQKQLFLDSIENATSDGEKIRLKISCMLFIQFDGNF